MKQIPNQRTNYRQIPKYACDCSNSQRINLGMRACVYAHLHNKSLGSTCLYTPSIGVTGAHHHAWLLVGVGDPNLGPHRLMQLSYFTH